MIKKTSIFLTVLLVSFVFLFSVKSVQAQQCITGQGGCPDGAVCDCTGEPGCGSGEGVRGVCTPVLKSNGQNCGNYSECTSGFCSPDSGICASRVTAPACSTGWVFDSNVNGSMVVCQSNGTVKYECPGGTSYNSDTHLCAQPTSAPVPTNSDSQQGSQPEDQPSSPLLPNDSFLILTNPLIVDGAACNSILECALKDPLGAIKVVSFSRPAGVLNALIPYLFTFAGLILFVMLLWGGFEMLSGAATPQSQEAGKQRITAALTGFALLFMSYWFAQIVEYIFGLNIL